MWQAITKFVIPFLMKRVIKRAAKAFRDSRGPEFHGKMSDRAVWDRAVNPLITNWRATTNEVDDIAADFAYWYYKGYINDGKLLDYVRVAEAAIDSGSPLTAKVALRNIHSLVEMPGRAKP